MESKHSAKVRAELEELRRRVVELEEQLEASTADESSEPDENRRLLVQGAWMAPVIMAVNIPGSVFAQNMVSPAGKPTKKPTPKSPSSKPTMKPSSKPTKKPSSKPTMKPSSKPTKKPSPKSPSPTQD